MRVDLHIHTTASDGCWDPEDLIIEIDRAGIGLFAVTDHDSIEHVAPTADLAEQVGLNFVKGVELTTKYNNKVCHVLGYGIDPSCPTLIELCEDNTERMRNLNIQQMRELIEGGIDVDLDEFIDYKFDKRRGGGTVTNFLVDKGIFGTFKESLAFVAQNARWETPDYPPPEAAVEIIKSARGHPILAHPGSTLVSNGLTDSELDRLVDMGIEGLECYTSYHTDEDTNRFLSYCRKRGLLITAGSDCHGPLLKERVLGRPAATLEQLNLGDIWQA